MKDDSNKIRGLIAWDIFDELQQLEQDMFQTKGIDVGNYDIETGVFKTDQNGKGFIHNNNRKRDTCHSYALCFFMWKAWA